jgi:hypothetical protein
MIGHCKTLDQKSMTVTHRKKFKWVCTHQSSAAFDAYDERSTQPVAVSK